MSFKSISTAATRYIDAAWRTVAGIGLVLLATWLAYQLHLNLAAAALIQLLAVLAIALKAGFWPATIVSIVANGCLNYFFIPPLFTLYVPDRQDWVALVVFEVSALVASRLSAQAQDQTDQAKRHRRELERLYEFSTQLLLLGRRTPGRQILSLIQKVFLIDAGVLFDASKAELELVGVTNGGLEAETRGAYLQDRDSQSADARTWIRVLRLGVRPIGAIGLQGDGLTAVTSNALASLTAVALERVYSLERETRAEAERQSEQLRTTVLDALAHEYKSPLTTIRTATTGLIEMGDTSEAHSELIGLIDSETKRLTELTTRLLKTSRLDRTDVRIRPERIQVDELILGLLSVSESLTSGHDVKVVGLETGAYIRADRELVNMALTQLIDNAGKYSDPGSTITLAAQVSPGVVCISVHSIGPPIRKEDRERIFQRFYRAPGSNHKSAGTGIGLSITRKVAEAHKGRVWAVSHEAQGNTFFLELPRCTREEA